ncbi:hypothetical protein HA48_18525 [Pantoea wallisii]|uniref:Type III secretion protein n=1 Tax=Pantoea wallisii TaxID=1076551 RepID=A0A1X1CZT8_9GAMM|nr:type III secretion protein [Pantoea wallisii]ORM69896.1 hypothetical protein HA48_18525 [Pantoea wallisii]
MRRHVDAETPADTDAQAVELQKILQVLLPIRKQRLSRSERQQRQQEQKLQLCQQAQRMGEQQLADHSRRYQTTSAAFLPQHQGKQTPLHALNAAIEDEQQKRDDMQQQQQQVERLASASLQQQAHSEAALCHVRRCQRDVEKIEYLLQNSEVIRS